MKIEKLLKKLASCLGVQFFPGNTIPRLWGSPTLVPCPVNPPDQVVRSVFRQRLEPEARVKTNPDI